MRSPRAYTPGVLIYLILGGLLAALWPWGIAALVLAVVVAGALDASRRPPA